MSSPYEQGLGKTPANYQPLSPITFLERAASTFPDHRAVVHGDLEFTYAELWSRCRRLASALKARSIKKNDTVATLLANVPAQIEAHYGVPLCGAVLNTINYRLSPGEVAFILDHGEAKVLFCRSGVRNARKRGAQAGKSQTHRHRRGGCRVRRARARWRDRI